MSEATCPPAQSAQRESAVGKPGAARHHASLGVAWPATAQMHDQPALRAECRYAGTEGMAFTCAQELALGTELILWVGLPGGDDVDGDVWTDFSLRVIDTTTAAAGFGMTCVYRRMPPQTMARLLVAYQAALAAAVTAAVERPKPLATDAQPTAASLPQTTAASLPSSPVQAPAPLVKPRPEVVATKAPTLTAALTSGAMAVEWHLERLVACGSAAQPLMQHFGTLDAPVMQALFQKAHDRLADVNLSPIVRRKLYACFVEMVRNAHAHAAALTLDAPQRSAAPLTAVSLQLPTDPSGGVGGWVTTANVMAAHDMARLQGMAQALNTMAPAALAQAYRQSMDDISAGPSPAEAPGFGWLTLAREASAPVQVQCSVDPGTQAWAPAYLVVKVQI